MEMYTLFRMGLWYTDDAWLYHFIDYDLLDFNKSGDVGAIFDAYEKKFKMQKTTCKQF